MEGFFGVAGRNVRITLKIHYLKKIYDFFYNKYTAKSTFWSSFVTNFIKLFKNDKEKLIDSLNLSWNAYIRAAKRFSFNTVKKNLRVIIFSEFKSFLKLGVYRNKKQSLKFRA